MLSSRIIKCPIPERKSSLELLYRRFPSAVRERIVGDLLEDASQGRVDLSGLWIAPAAGPGAGPPAAVLLTQDLSCKSLGVWPPAFASPWRRRRLASALLKTAFDAAREEGFVMAQALLGQEYAHRDSVDLTLAGMPKITDLIYLERYGPFPGIAEAEVRIRWRSYAPAIHAEFRDVVAGSYQDSLDMPELLGLRTIDEILEGYQSERKFNPETWLIGTVAGESLPSAVLLLDLANDEDAWEVTYLGLTPQARGKRLGREILAAAFERARVVPLPIRLAVDARNLPAIKLYQSCGFLERERRAVHFVSLVDNNPPAR